MHVVGTDCEVKWTRRYEIKNCLRSIIAVSREIGVTRYLDIVPGDHISKCII